MGLQRLSSNSSGGSGLVCLLVSMAPCLIRKFYHFMVCLQRTMRDQQSVVVSELGEPDLSPTLLSWPYNARVSYLLFHSECQKAFCGLP